METISKKERDYNKKNIRLIKRVIFWFLVIVLVFGTIAGVVFLSSNNQPNLVSDASLEINQADQFVGQIDSQVVLVEYGDYQCPACAAYHSVVKQVIDEYEDRILFVYRHFPLPQHRNAKMASYASEAAGVQEKFWEMHDFLYDNQSRWTTLSPSNFQSYLNDYAEEIGLDVEKFVADMSNESIKLKVNSDLVGGQKIGVRGTPSFFLNNEQIFPRSYEEIKNLIDSSLNDQDRQ